MNYNELKLIKPTFEFGKFALDNLDTQNVKIPQELMYELLSKAKQFSTFKNFIMESERENYKELLEQKGKVLEEKKDNFTSVVVTSNDIVNHWKKNTEETRSINVAEIVNDDCLIVQSLILDFKAIRQINEDFKDNILDLQINEFDKLLSDNIHERFIFNAGVEEALYYHGYDNNKNYVYRDSMDKYKQILQRFYSTTEQIANFYPTESSCESKASSKLGACERSSRESNVYRVPTYISDYYLIFVLDDFNCTVSSCQEATYRETTGVLMCGGSSSQYVIRINVPVTILKYPANDSVKVGRIKV